MLNCEHMVIWRPSEAAASVCLSQFFACTEVLAHHKDRAVLTACLGAACCADFARFSGCVRCFASWLWVKGGSRPACGVSSTCVPTLEVWHAYACVCPCRHMCRPVTLTGEAPHHRGLLCYSSDKERLRRACSDSSQCWVGFRQVWHIICSSCTSGGEQMWHASLSMGGASPVVQLVN